MFLKFNCKDLIPLLFLQGGGSYNWATDFTVFVLTLEWLHWPILGLLGMEKLRGVSQHKSMAWLHPKDSRQPLWRFGMAPLANFGVAWHGKLNRCVTCEKKSSEALLSIPCCTHLLQLQCTNSLIRAWAKNNRWEVQPFEIYCSGTCTLLLVCCMYWASCDVCAESCDHLHRINPSLNIASIRNCCTELFQIQSHYTPIKSSPGFVTITLGIT